MRLKKDCMPHTISFLHSKTLPPSECNPLSFDHRVGEYICMSCSESPSLSTIERRSLSVFKRFLNKTE